ncbi:hypothetical protein LCGC14_1130450 [marine sediment metagenome]|uniref:HNH nuclease domain-containing protein n=1 Tax=marine sediment metagenome TaxID=412755 RepID=A0A0F9PJI0_9ZZZZ
MTQLGDIKRAKEIGRAGANKYMWVNCPVCEENRWVETRNGIPKSQRCRRCVTIQRNKEMNPKRLGEKHPLWKGGRLQVNNGYVYIYVPRDDFFYSMVNHSGYVLEHRLVMAKSLGRNLYSWEVVHHKNHIRDDNRRENLQLVSVDRHRQITILERKVNDLEKRVTLLEAENIILKGATNGYINPKHHDYGI